MNYYGKFLPNLATTLAPLDKLLAKGVCYDWSQNQQDAFDTVKSQLASSKVLVHYDSDIDLVLSCDASLYGVCAVLSHRFSADSERPIAYASHTMAPAEKRYSHMDKEALAIIFGLKRFHQFLYGHKFIIYMDHKPLSYLFDPTQAIPHLASSHLQRWALTLSAYTYSIEYKSGKSNSNADAFSRLLLPDTPTDIPMSADTVFLLEKLNDTPVMANMIKRWTNQDPVLAKVKHCVLKGWPSSVMDSGPFMNSMFLIIANAHKTWSDIHLTSSSTALITTFLHTSLEFHDKNDLITRMRLTDELNTLYNTKPCILDLTNGRLPAVDMVTKLIITSHQLPCNTSIDRRKNFIVVNVFSKPRLSTNKKVWVGNGQQMSKGIFFRFNTLTISHNYFLGWI